MEVRLIGSTTRSAADDPLSFSGDPQVGGATLVRIDRQPAQIQFDCLPTPGVTTIEVRVPLDCNGLGTCFFVRFNVGQPLAGTAIGMTAYRVGDC
jgi:hypothetical protein